MVSETTITFRCDIDMKAQIEYIAEINCLKVSQVIRAILKDYLEQEGAYNG